MPLKYLAARTPSPPFTHEWIVRHLLGVATFFALKYGITLIGIKLAPSDTSDDGDDAAGGGVGGGGEDGLGSTAEGGDNDDSRTVGSSPVELRCGFAPGQVLVNPMRKAGGSDFELREGDVVFYIANALSSRIREKKDELVSDQMKAFTNNKTEDATDRLDPDILDADIKGVKKDLEKVTMRLKDVGEAEAATRRRSSINGATGQSMHSFFLVCVW